jgi:hypothetical protein
MSPRTRRLPLAPLAMPPKQFSPEPSSTTLSGADIPTSFYASRASLGQLSDEQQTGQHSSNPKVDERSQTPSSDGPKSNSWFDVLSFQISLRVWQCVGLAGLLVGVGFGIGYAFFSFQCRGLSVTNSAIRCCRSLFSHRLTPARLV